MFTKFVSSDKLYTKKRSHLQLFIASNYQFLHYFYSKNILSEKNNYQDAKKKKSAKMLTKVRENGYRANAVIRLEAFIKNVEMILVILTTSPRGL